ncbi:hypothetical protein SBA4_1010047 [Candidatus Sulfopaludibacter sp. SbA4]|nr:hypothetical protein SBA4_1010047 [Candidatus Sulfopaludibacter sp. SbA4]
MPLRDGARPAVTGWRAASSRFNWRVPTPVSSITMSNSPAKRRSANRQAPWFSSIGTSRMEGAPNGSPPCLRMSSAISAERRLSSERTRIPANDMTRLWHSRLFSMAVSVTKADGKRAARPVPIVGQVGNLVGNLRPTGNRPLRDRCFSRVSCLTRIVAQ